MGRRIEAFLLDAVLLGEPAGAAQEPEHARADGADEARDVGVGDRVRGKAVEALGLVARENLGLPDTGVRDDDASARALVELLRRQRPAVLLAPHGRDFHPDHVAGQDLVEGR